MTALFIGTQERCCYWANELGIVHPRIIGEIQQIKALQGPFELHWCGGVSIGVLYQIRHELIHRQQHPPLIHDHTNDT